MAGDENGEKNGEKQGLLHHRHRSSGGRSIENGMTTALDPVVRPVSQVAGSNKSHTDEQMAPVFVIYSFLSLPVHGAAKTAAMSFAEKSSSFGVFSPNH